MPNKKFEALVGLLITIVLLLSYFRVSQEIIDWVVELYVMHIIIGSITSWAAGQLVEGLTGNFLKQSLLVVEIKGVRFSISVFLITVLLVKFLLFR